MEYEKTYLPMVLSFSAGIFAIRGNIGITLLTHLTLLLVNPVFAFSFWMSMRALNAI